MRISFNSEHRIWIAESAFSDKDTLKAAGFWWHQQPGGCRFQGCKACAAGVRMKWWTFKPESAARLVQYSADEATKESLQPTIKSLDGSRAADAEINIPVPDGLAYLGFQKAGIAYALGRKNCLIADEMGLGKTIQALGVLAVTRQKAIIVCPASLKLNWQREAAKWLPEFSSCIISSHPSPQILEALKRTGMFDLEIGKNALQKPSHVNGTAKLPIEGKLGGLVPVLGAHALSSSYKAAEFSNPIHQALVCVTDGNAPGSQQIINARLDKTNTALPIKDPGQICEINSALGKSNSNVLFMAAQPMSQASLQMPVQRHGVDAQFSGDHGNWLVALNYAADNRLDDLFINLLKLSARQSDLIIINYDIILQWLPVLQHLTGRRLILDEVHKLKNPKAKRTIAVLGQCSRNVTTYGLAKIADGILALSGTPILNRPIELQPIAGAIAPKMFGNFFIFAKRYCAAFQTKYGWDFTGASNLDELQTRLRTSIMVRRLKVDVLKELPPKTRSVILLSQNGLADDVKAEQLEFSEWEGNLDEAHADAELALASGDVEAYSAAVARLDSHIKIAFSEMSAARHRLAVAKVPAVIEHCDEVLEGGVDKLVIFAHHHDVISALTEHYGLRAVVLTGENTPEDRQSAVDRFQNDPNVKVFIGSIQAAGVGITLTAASHVVFAELDWVPGNVTQAEDRCHRIGQHDNVTIQHLVVDGSLDAKLANILVWKQHIIEQALDTQRALPTPVTGNADPATLPMPSPKYPKATEAQRTACAAGLQILAGMCDGAHKQDGEGFNRMDTRIGRQLAAKSMTRDLTDGECWLARRILPKYHGQIGQALIATVKGLTTDGSTL